ncbi:MAG: hypothetical protein RIR12_2483 [Bacteroidota bacterium]|jgi:uncharacterized Fe-S cluster protein YjdI
MPIETKKYTNGEVTIVWQPKLCIHSAICAKGLPGVFNPQRRPWIGLSASTTNIIIEQVNKCPSGALSYYINNTTMDNQQTTPPATEKLIIQAAPNGPFLIKTECVIIHSNGTEETKTGTVALCRCGASTNKPYCDGKHKSIGFEG